MSLHHVNFHTVREIPVFEQAEYDAMLRGCLRDLFRRHKILCLAWEVMPTHVHLVIADFPDFSRGEIVGRVKGGTSHAFFQAYPDLRTDLLGGHLWSKSYFSALITTHAQLCATIAYVRANRAQADLPPPVPLQPVE